jgi:hypothetical protein
MMSVHKSYVKVITNIYHKICYRMYQEACLLYNNKINLLRLWSVDILQVLK